MSDEYIGEKKKSPFGLVAIIAAVIVVAIGGYALVGKTTDKATEPAVVEQTQTASPEVAAPSLEATPENNIVVETKQLDVPTADAPMAADAVPAAPSDPAVDVMMAPRSIGKADAPVKITEYSSLTCGHCAAFHKDTLPEFKKKFIDTGRVQLTFKEFPLNLPAIEASMILRCMPQDKYESFMSLLFAEQEKWAFAPNYQEFLKQNATLAGMPPEDFDKCLANTILKNRIVGNMQAASLKYKIQSTPSFVLNDGARVLVGNQPIAEFEKAIAELEAKAKDSATPSPAPSAQPVTPSAPDSAASTQPAQ
jgi:protein-disulfide isomerase